MENCTPIPIKWIISSFWSWWPLFFIFVMGRGANSKNFDRRNFWNSIKIALWENFSLFRHVFKGMYAIPHTKMWKFLGKSKFFKNVKKWEKFQNFRFFPNCQKSLRNDGILCLASGKRDFEDYFCVFEILEWHPIVFERGKA